MDTESIGAALRRKLGPLPVWIWAIFGGAVLYFLRKRGYFGGMGAAQGDTLQPSQANATPPQAQVPLQPGESVYDPNTGSLSTAPGGDSGGSGGTDVGQAIDDLAAALESGHTTSEKTNPSTPRGGVKHSRVTSSHHKPAAKKGSKRAAKQKPAHKQAGHKTTAHKPASHGAVKRPRSKTTQRLVNGGRTASKVGRAIGGRATAKPSSAKARVATATPATTVRQRATVGLTRQTGPVQHPVSSHPARSVVTHAAPRPSAPPPRTQRTPPAKKPAPAPTRKRK